KDVAGVDLNCFGIVGYGVVLITLCVVSISPTVVGQDVLRIEPDRLRQLRDGIVMLFVDRMNEASTKRCTLWIQTHGAVVIGQCLLVVVRVAIGAAGRDVGKCHLLAALIFFVDETRARRNAAFWNA